MTQANLPAGWSEERVRRVLAHYQEQTEDEAAFASPSETVVEVPIELLPKVRELLARHAQQNEKISAH